MTVKLPKDNSVGYDVIVDLAKFPNNSCPEGWPVISVSTVDKLLKANVYENDTCDPLITRKNVFEFKGFLSVILKFTFEFVDDMLLTGKSKVTPLNTFVADAANVVLPVMYTLLPSLADMTIFKLIGAKEAGFLALFKVIVFEFLVEVVYNEEKTKSSTPKLANKLILHWPPQTEVVFEVRKFDLEKGPHGSNCNCTTDPASI